MKQQIHVSGCGCALHAAVQPIEVDLRLAGLAGWLLFPDAIWAYWIINEFYIVIWHCPDVLISFHIIPVRTGNAN